jgi:hypothetical protein
MRCVPPKILPYGSDANTPSYLESTAMIQPSSIPAILEALGRLQFESGNLEYLPKDASSMEDVKVYKVGLPGNFVMPVRLDTKLALVDLEVGHRKFFLVDRILKITFE